MMTGKEAYRIWAPAGKKWVDWVRPVPFVAVDEYSKSYHVSNIESRSVSVIGETRADTAIVVDLPGDESVWTGVALAKAGYRPIPIYNGTIEQSGARATVDNQSVGIALIEGAKELVKMDIKDCAPPAFLVDSNRLNRYKMEVALFDNSWDVYPQDMPSAEYLISSGINRCIIVGNRLAKDLKKILYMYQKRGVEIFLTNGYEETKRIIIRRPLLGNNE